ncbi:MAG: ATP-binding protein [Thermodesulfobacteriota bacterium]
MCAHCDSGAAVRAARFCEPVDYWCDWGLRDIAVPILLHGFSLGTIFCGQKALDNEAEDAAGIDKLKKFAQDNGLTAELSTLLDLRTNADKATVEQIRQMKGFLWATSQAISRAVTSRLGQSSGERVQALRAKIEERRDEIRHKLSALAGRPGIDDFWERFKGILESLTDLLDCLGIAVCLSYNGRADLVCSHGLPIKDKSLKSLPETSILTSTLERLDGLQRFRVEPGRRQPDCIICKQVLSEHRNVHIILYAKSRLELDKYLHLFAFFDPSLPARYNLLLHQRERQLSRIMSETVNLYWLLEQQQTLKSKLKEKDEYLRNVFHEVKQPLHSIVAYCHNLADPDFPHERKQRIPRYVVEIGKHISMMLGCLEYASRGERDIIRQDELRAAATNLSKMLIDCAIDMQGYSEQRKAKIHVEVNTTDPAGKIYVDKSAFQMAIGNVLFNAVKYSVPLTPITVAAKRENNRTVITVTSTGVGIPKDLWERVFERGFRVDEATSYSQSGLGIGLFVTREIMRAMGGHAYIKESEPLGWRHGQFALHRNVVALDLPGPDAPASGGKRAARGPADGPPRNKGNEEDDPE